MKDEFGLHIIPDNDPSDLTDEQFNSMTDAQFDAMLDANDQHFDLFFADLEALRGF